MRNKLRRPLAFLLSAVMIVTMSGTPVHAVADRGQPETGLCEHHTAHTDDCGYTEETPGTPCGHEHTEDCYIEVTECVHEHTPECYPEETEDSVSDNEATPANAEEREPENCPHICDGESGCITEKLDCRHEHDSECGYTESTPGTPCTYVCEICNPQDSGEADEEPETGIIKQEQCSCLTLCTEGQINPDCPVCGAEDAGLSDCKGKAEKEDTKQPEDTGICKHHQEHDDACGYQPESEDSEGSPCTYECRICPIEDLIAALPEQVTEDNADDVRAQLDKILALYRELDEGEQEEIDLSRVTKLQEALDVANAPMQAAGEINISQNSQNKLTEEDGDCPGHTFTGTAQTAMIYVESGAHNVTFSRLNITGAAYVGIAPGATMNLTLEDSNTIKGFECGIYVPKGATLVTTAESAGSLDVSGPYSAGIGGSLYDLNSNDGDIDCGTVIINGGNITATGGSAGYASAGIGGAAGDNTNDGNGGNITINGGKVTAKGGYNGVSNAPGIGGSTSAKSDGTLTISSADVLDGNTTLGAKGTYTITGDPTADMIVVSEDLIYNGKVQELDGKIYIDDSKTGTGTYFGQTFTVNASADGWTYTIDPAVVKAAGDYTVTFSKEGHTSISKTFTVAQSGTQFVGDGEVKTFNGETQTDTFTAGDTITVKATPTPTGAAPTNSAMFAASFTPPTTGQMAVFVGDTQVSQPAEAVDGSYTMEVSAADVLLAAGGPGTGITLTAKFVGNDNMADGTGTATVNITAAAKAELDGKVIGYYGESNLDKAFANDGATVTLLDNITTSMHVGVDTGNLTLDLNGKTITKPASYGLYVSGSGHLTIRGNGKVICTGTSGFYPEAITSVGGTLTLEGGTFIGLMYGVRVDWEMSVLSVTGESVSIQGERYGLLVASSQSVQLSAGTYSSISAGSSHTLAGLLAVNCAYYKGSTPVPLSELEGKTELTGPVTVQACQHTAAEYTPNENDASTHTKTCLACGYTETGDCGFEKTADPTADSHTGQCPDCERDRSGAHSFSDWAGNPVARTCTVCGYEQTAVARVEKNSTTTYVGALANAFTEGNSGATVTLLSEVDLGSNYIGIGIRGSSTFTLDLNGQTVKASYHGAFDISDGSLTIQDSGTGGKIESSNITIEVTGGTLSIQSGTVSGYTGVQISSGAVNISGGTISGSDTGLKVTGGGNIAISGGTFSGVIAVEIHSNASVTLKDLLAAGYAYHQNDIPVANAEGPGGEVPLDAKPAWLPGTVTVKKCQHNGEGVCEYTHATGTTTHQQTCLACGKKWDEENCSYTNGGCACGSTLAVTLPADLALTYDGTAKTPAVTVTVDGTELAAEKYQINYDNNINAGNTAKVTVTGTAFNGTVEKTFAIKKATLTIKASDQTITYGQSITEGTGQVTATGLCAGDSLSSITLAASTRNVPGGTIELSAAQIKNSSSADMTANYTITYQPGTLTINKAAAPAITWPAANGLTYGPMSFT